MFKIRIGTNFSSLYGILSIGVMMLIPVVQICGAQPQSPLERLIAPEIKNDPFYADLYRIARTENLKTILEIGSSSGEGSTEALVRGILENEASPTLFCIEISSTRFQKLHSYYQTIPQVVCYHASSVPAFAFPSESEVIHFYRTVRTWLNQFSLARVIEWLRDDIQYIQLANVPQNGIEQIKLDNGIDFFDMVLIDGSEFAGKAELDQVYGARWILLDDVNAFKNYNNYHRLLQDKAYQLMEGNWNIRHGYAIFKKKN